MTFQEHMTEAAQRVEGLSGAAVADSDGIIVEEYKKNTLIDMPLLVAEYGALWRAADKSGLNSGTGTTNELSVMTEEAILVIRRISPDYFLLFVIESEKSFGKGRFYARIIAEDLAEGFGL